MSFFKATAFVWTLPAVIFRSLIAIPTREEPFGTSTAVKVANQTIHHSGAYPSHILLPVIP